MSLREAIRRLAREESGFGLIEMLAALMIVVAVMGAIVTLMVSAMKAEVDLTKRVQAQQETRLALERIRHEIHRACKAEHMNLAIGVAGVVDTTAGTKTNVRLTPPAGSACPTSTDPATAVTWCMAGTGSRWALRRVVGTPASCAGGRLEADFITTSAVFTLQQPAGSLATLNVKFPVKIDPADGMRAYRLEDSLVLRNSSR